MPTIWQRDASTSTFESQQVVTSWSDTAYIENLFDKQTFFTEEKHFLSNDMLQFFWAFLVLMYEMK